MIYLEAELSENKVLFDQIGVTIISVELDTQPNHVKTQRSRDRQRQTLRQSDRQTEKGVVQTRSEPATSQ